MQLHLLFLLQVESERTTRGIRLVLRTLAEMFFMRYSSFRFGCQNFDSAVEILVS
jgi:hypothetical protein